MFPRRKGRSWNRQEGREYLLATVRHSYDDENTCGICGGPCGVTHGVDLSYVVDVGSPRKNMKNRKVRPLRCEEDP